MITMRSIHCHPPFFPFSHPNHKQYLNTTKLLWLTSNQSTGHLNKQNSYLKAKAIPTSLVLGVTSSAKPGDISVLLQTGAVMMFAYLIANFVLPEFILKDLQSNQTSEDQKVNKDSLSEVENGNTSENSKSSPPKKRGFNSKQ